MRAKPLNLGFSILFGVCIIFVYVFLFFPLVAFNDFMLVYKTTVTHLGRVCLVLVEKECFLQRMNDFKLYLKGVRTKRMRNAVATLQTNLIPVCKYFLVLPRARKMDTKVFFF